MEWRRKHWNDGCEASFYSNRPENISTISKSCSSTLSYVFTTEELYDESQKRMKKKQKSHTQYERCCWLWCCFFFIHIFFSAVIVYCNKFRFARFGWMCCMKNLIVDLLMLDWANEKKNREKDETTNTMDVMYKITIQNNHTTLCYFIVWAT